MKTNSIQRAFLGLTFTFLGLFFQLGQTNAQLLLDPAASGGPLSNVVASSGSANTSITIAYSIRQLKTTYDHPATITPPAAVTGFTNSTQPLLRVRRSFDNAQLDIGYDINGNLDSVTLKNFVTGKIGMAGPTNPTASGFVTVWYDQSGNSRDAFQTNTSQQPRIINAGVIERNSGGQIGFYGVSGGMLEHQTSAGAPMNEPAGINIYGIDADRTMTVVSQPRVYANGGAADGGGTYLIDRNGSTGDQDRPLTCLKAVNNNWTAQIRNLAGDISSSFEGSVPISTSRSDNVFLLRSGNLYSLYVNGIFAGSNTLIGENRMTPVRIGYGTNTGEQVYYGEFILFPSALSNTNLTALNNSQNTYFVLGPSPGTWTGLLSNDWNTSGNWSNNAVPSSITDVTIPAGATTPLVITSGQTTLATKKLTIASGASVTINGNINVNDSFVMNGTTTGTGTITMSGALRQTIRGTAGASINNLVIANTADTVWASTNINIAGTLTINANAEFGAAATAIVNSAAAAGTITGNGTVLVTRTASVADYQSQYRFTTNTLTNLTVNYQGAGDQSINLGVNYGNLAVSGSGIKTLSGAITATNITGAITVNAGTLSTANNNIGSPTNRTITIGPNGILDAGSGIISFGTGTKTITINGTFRTANTNGFTGSATTAIDNTNTPTVTLGSASTIEYSASSAQTVTARTDYANLTMSNGSKTVSGTITLSGALTINTGATYNGAANPVLTVAGNFTNNGTFTSGTGAVTFNGTTAQTITGATTFGGNVVWSGAGLKTLASNIVVTGDQNINSGATLNLATFTANRSATGGTLTVAGTLRVGGNTGGQTGSNFPLNFTTNTLSGTVIYDGSNAITQTVFATTYTNLTLTNGSGSGTANKVSTASFAVNTGNFTINTGARFTPAAANIISGTGTLTGTGIVEVTGTDLPTQYTITNKVLTNLTINYAGGSQTIPGGTYSSLTVTGGGTKTLGGAVTVTGSVTIDASNTLDVSASNFALNVGGNFTNNGTFTQRAGTVTLNGSGSQTISGSTTTTFNNLTISKTTDTTFVNSSINVSGTLSIGTSVNTVFFPSATSIINATAAGTLSGSGGTIYVTRVLATADFRTQYNFSTYTLANLTVNYCGAGNQTINITGTPTINYSNLVVSGSGTKTVNGAITGTNVTGSITVSAATMSMNNQNLGSPANRTITIAAGATFDGGTGIVSFGATTRVININGTFRTANTTAFTGNVNGSISSTNTPTITLGTASTIEYYSAVAQPVTARTDYANVTLSNGSKTMSGTVTLSGDLLINTGATYNGAANPTLTVAGNFTNNGTFTQGTNLVTFSSTTNQTIGGTTTTSFGNITFSGSGGVATLSANIQTTGNLTVSTGKTLNLSTFTANRTAAGGTLSVAGTLRVGGTTGGQAGSNFPSNFTTFTPTGGTVEYYANGGTTQTVFATTYNNLTLTNANGLDTAFKISTGNIGIGAGTFSIGLRVRFQPAAGNVITGAGGTLTGFGSIDVSGTADLATQYNITTRTLTNLTVNYTGTTQTIAAGTYPLLTISGGGTKTLGGAVISTGTVTINSGNTLDVSVSNYTLNVGGDWTNNGTFVQRSGTVNFDGINAQTIGGTTATTFNNLTISNTAAAVSVTNNMNVQGTLNINGTNAQLSPSATSVINSGGAGTSILTGTGIVYVSRVAVTADFKNQYVFNTYTLGTLTVNYNGSGNQTVNFGGTPAVNYSNLIISGSGTKTMDAAITATNLTGNLTVNSGTFFTNNLNIASPANRTITVATGAIFDAGTSVITYGATIRVLNLNGTFRTANTNGFSGGASTAIASTNTPTLVLNSNSTVEYYGVGAQTVTLSHNYGNLQINGVGTKTLAAAITTTNVTGDIIVTSGNLSNGGFAITGNNDNEINIGAGDSLSLTSTSSFPSGFGTFTIANTSTVLYSGANQNIASRSYGNLVASGTGTKVLLGNTTVNGNLTTSGTGFSASSFTLTVNGNWVNNGTFTASTSTVILNGTSSQGISGSTSPTFNNLTLTNSAGSVLSVNAEVSGVLTLTSGALSIGANTLTLSGTVSGSSGLVGSTSSNLTVNGTGALGTLTFVTNTNLLNMTLNRTSSGTATLGSALTVGGTLTLTAGELSLNNQTLTLNGTVTGAGSFTGSNGSSMVIGGSGAFGTLRLTTNTNLQNLTINRSTSGSVTLGSTLGLASTGSLILTNGEFNLNGNTLTLNGQHARTSGTITGSTASSLSLRGAVTFTNPLVFTTGSQTLGTLTVNNGGGNFALGSALSVSTTLALTAGILNLNGQTLTVDGNISGTGATIAGSTSSVLIVNGTGAITAASISFTSGSRVLNTLTLNRSTATFTLGTDLQVTSALNLTSGRLAIGSNTLTLDGNFSGSASNSLVLNGSSNITVGGSGSIGNLFFDQTTPGTTNRINNLTYNRASQTITLGNGLQVRGVVTPTAGTLATGGNLTLISDATNTARIAAGTGSYISGDVTAQRFIPSVARRWRFLGSPVSGRTLADWKNEIYITGTGGAANGFDVTAGNVGSVFSYNESVAGDLNQGFTGATNITNSIAVGTGYRVFVRGDRSDPNRLSGTNTTQNAVTLDLVGPVNTGNITMPVTYTNQSGLANDGWNLVGNPYPSDYNWNAYYDAAANYSNIDPTIYIYDPLANGYVSYNAVSNTGTGTLSSGIIPQGSAFWVKANAASPSMTFVETYKTNTGAGMIFKAENTTFRLRLIRDSLNSDELCIKYITGSTTDYDAYDIRKLPGAVNVSAYGSDSVLLAASIRPIPTQNDTIYLRIAVGTSSSMSGTYTLEFNNTDQINLQDQLWLVDTYTGTIVDMQTTPSYTFSITTSIPASQGSGRFYIVVGNNSQLPVGMLFFRAVKTGTTASRLSWSTAYEEQNLGFEVERSTNGQQYESIGFVQGKGTTQRISQYVFMDMSTARGLNYYRLKQLDKDGKVHYSEVRVLDMEGNMGSGMELYPNPATSYTEVVNKEGKEWISYRMMRTTGEVLRKGELSGMSSTIGLDGIPTGIYLLEATDEDGNLHTTKLLVE